jgi:ABC-type molybdenum transport system ATPase subunit/photorepair protein PhrA
MSSRSKVVLIGDPESGRTSLYNCIVGEKFKSAYEPTSSNESEKNCQKNILVKVGIVHSVATPYGAKIGQTCALYIGA